MEELQPIMTDLPSITSVIKLSYYVLLGLFAVFTAVLYYHWMTYATNKAVIRITLVLYMACTLPLLLIMGFIMLSL